MTQSAGSAGRAAGRRSDVDSGAEHRAADETTRFEPVPDEADVAGAHRAARAPRSSFSYPNAADRSGERAPAGSAVLTTPVGASRSPRRPVQRRARLTLTRIDPWSVLKSALVFTTCLLVVWMIAIVVLYGILSGAGVFHSINNTLSDALGSKIDFNGVYIVGGALILGAFNVVLLSALATVAAFAYNITVGLIGGLDVTLAEHE